MGSRQPQIFRVALVTAVSSRAEEWRFAPTENLLLTIIQCAVGRDVGALSSSLLFSLSRSFIARAKYRSPRQLQAGRRGRSGAYPRRSRLTFSGPSDCANRSPLSAALFAIGPGPEPVRRRCARGTIGNANTWSSPVNRRASRTALLPGRTSIAPARSRILRKPLMSATIVSVGSASPSRMTRRRGRSPPFARISSTAEAILDWAWVLSAAKRRVWSMC